MHLSDVKEVVETNSKEAVNMYLDAGWTLLDTASGKTPEYGESYIKYSLGWDKDGVPVVPEGVVGRG
ncbi:hypothetical protein Ga0123461_0712 [Mariprofundus aestuarium]|uniref:Uncharacterized protein n=1 Tax=Mariprofundus aestuarium TaxID=1921086 RepID=A0A2K8KWA4_MARES|nr:hypothetical protein [Mariprofundus aestuarium]ATX79138.1 hypothetical protein Ga0123461_0712 [Mariprofundus aestuarium]